MEQDFKNKFELDSYVKEILILDLLEEAYKVPEDPFLHAIEPEKEGLYLPGGTEPLLTLDKRYYPSSIYNALNLSKSVSKEHHLKTLEQIKNCSEDLYDEKGNLVISARKLRQYNRYFKEEPTVPANLIKVSAAMAMEHLSRIDIRASFNGEHPEIEELILPEYHGLITHGDLYLGYFDLYITLENFISQDSWHLYRVTLKGTTLYVEKQMDLRIYEWYLQKFRDEELLEERKAEELERLINC